MESRDFFIESSHNLQTWIMNLPASLGEGNRNNYRIYNALHMIGEIIEKLPSIERSLDAWRERIIQADLAGVDAVAQFGGVSHSTAHDCAWWFLYHVTREFQEFYLPKNFPEDFDKWTAKQEKLVKNWFAKRESTIGDESVLKSRMQRELIKVVGANTRTSQGDGTPQKPRNNDPTQADMIIGRQVYDSMPVKKKTVEGFRTAMRAAGHSRNDTAMGRILRAIEKERAEPQIK
jgi:hypothetical protein